MQPVTHKRRKQPFFATARRKEVSHSTRDAKRAPHKSLGSRPHAHGRRSMSPTCTAGPFTQAHVRRGFASKLAAYARWMEQASKAVQRWKKIGWVEWRRTLGTERDLYQAQFRKNVRALGLHRPATTNAITRKWHLVPVSNSGYLRRLSCSASWMACPCLRPLATP